MWLKTRSFIWARSLLFIHFSQFSLEGSKFRRSLAIVGLVSLLPSYHRAFVDLLSVQNIFSLVFCGFHIFFLVGPSWVQSFFLWVICRSKISFCGYFVGPRLFLAGISWVQNFLSKMFKILQFSIVGRIRKSDIETYLKLRILFQIDLTIRQP